MDYENLTFLEGGEVLYNDLYLLSETDEKGIITYVSKSFCKVSGYEKHELIGQPHNIVRHPEMPTNAFKNLWENAKNKGFWTGYVKNARKGGGYYWVYATILKKIEKNGKINYVSIRTKPSQENIKKAEKFYKTIK